MTDPAQALKGLLAGQPLPATLFPPTSRYAGIAIATLERDGDEPIAYLRRRFLPAPETQALLQFHAVKEGERLDQIAARYLADPELFWRIADANNAMRPEELTDSVGRRLRITLPPGIPGGTSG